jgi:hypothetical protein
MLTDTGSQFLKELAGTWVEMTESVSQIMTKTQQQSPSSNETPETV